jgi:hypothetical protein
MAKLPIIGLCGNADSGKSTAAKYIVNNLDGIEIALADPIKRFAMKVFGFTENQLWGPSSERNKGVGSLDRKEITLKAKEVICQLYYGYDLAGGGFSETQKSDAMCHLERDVLEQLNWDDITPRKVLQLIGTQWGRRGNPDIWITQAIQKAFAVFHGENYDKVKGSSWPGNPTNFVVISDVRFLNEALNLNKLNGTVFKIMTDKINTETHQSESELNTIPDHFFDEKIWNFKTNAFFSRLDEAIKKQYPDFKVSK